MKETGRLFPREALRLQRSGEARLRDLAARPSSRPDEAYETLERLRKWGADLAACFGLRFASLEAEAEEVTEYYGVCYRDGVIRIRLRHARTGRLLKESSLVDTLCHELAHLKYFDHSIRFRRFYRKILDEARRRGYYRPGPEPRPPRQGCLLPEGEAS